MMINGKLAAALGNHYPHQLETKFPHVLEKISELWESPDLEPYFVELLFDRRGGRQGFPQQVVAELFALYEIYDKGQEKGA